MAYPWRIYYYLRYNVCYLSATPSFSCLVVDYFSIIDLLCSFDCTPPMLPFGNFKRRILILLFRSLILFCLWCLFIRVFCCFEQGLLVGIIYEQVTILQTYTMNLHLRRHTWEPLTMISPNSLVLSSLPSTSSNSRVLLRTKFMFLSQLISFPLTSLPPLNLTTSSWCCSWLSLISDSLGTLIFKPKALIGHWNLTR